MNMKYTLLKALLLVTISAHSQTSFLTSGSNIYSNPTGNNVAIGGTTASQKLHVYGNILSTGFLMSNGTFSASGTNNLTFNTNSTTRLFVNQSTGNVGIGTITPSDRLTVSGNISSTGSIMSNGIFSSSGTNNLIFNTNSTLRLFINQSTGNVGIGTGTPSERLTVSGNISSSNNILSPKITPNILSQPSSNILDIQNFTGLSLMYFASNGRIGIGTTTPQEALHVNGSVRGNVNGALRINSGFGTLDIGATNSTTAHLSTDKSNFYFNKKLFVDEGIISSFDESLTLQAAGTSGILIEQGSGNVAIGTNDPKGYKLAVAGKVVAEEVNVKLKSNWPDYVFESDYKLPALSELENFIN
jgi:ethanolamine utilization microcompartment shell protein EutS